MNRPMLLACSALAAVLLLTGCSVATTTAPTPTAASTAAPAAPKPLHLPGQSYVQGSDKATLQSQQEALTLVEQLMPTFLNHTLTYEQWWAGVSPVLTAEAKYAWQDTDPRAIRGSQVTGPASVVTAPSSTLVVVQVPSDAGIWRLEVIRQAEDGATPGRWQVFSLTSPPRVRN